MTSCTCPNKLSKKLTSYRESENSFYRNDRSYCDLRDQFMNIQELKSFNKKKFTELISNKLIFLQDSTNLV